MKYPQHEKLKIVQDKTQFMKDFFDWLWQEAGAELCEWAENANFPHSMSVQKRDQLMYKFIDVDPVKLEAEKLAMLDELRKVNP